MMSSKPTPSPPITTNSLRPEQAAASHPRRNVWVNASAGTGKTTVLVARVVRLLLEGVAPWRILCLTYTKAAAAEMANRVLKKLASWSDASDDRLAADLADLTGMPPEPETILRARHLFLSLLDAPGGLQISTLHSFCQSLLARFPLEAGIPVGFHVLDDRLSATLLARAEKELLANPGDAGDALHRLLRLFGRTHFSGLLQSVISHRHSLKELFATRGGLVGVQHDLAVELGLPEIEGASVEAIRAELLHAFCSNPDREQLRPVAERLAANTTATNRDNGKNILAWLGKDLTERQAGWFAYSEIFLLSSRGVRAPTGLVTKTLNTQAPELLPVMLAEQAAILTLEAQLNAVSVYGSTTDYLILAKALLDRYESHKQTRLALDFDDLIQHAVNLVERDGGASWVLYKLDGGIDHVLVDEAQDTNPLQWRLLEALTAEYFAGASAREEPRTMFAVGDFKQSIYGFQGARPAAFLDASQRTAQKATAAGQPFDNIPLNRSFRSVPAILQLVDEVFQGPRGESISPEAVQHIAIRQGMAGRVELWPLLAPAPAVELPAWQQASAMSEPPPPHVEAAETIATLIASWHQQLPLPARGRPAHYGDILVLVRKRGKFVEALIRALKQRRIPVAGADRMKLRDQIVVEDVLALLDTLLLPADDLSLACVLRGPFVGLDDDELFKLAHDRPGGLRERLTSEVAKWLDSLAEIAATQLPYTLLARLLHSRCPAGPSGQEALLSRLGPEAADPLHELLATALHYEHETGPTLQGFLAWLRQTETELKRELEQASGQVRIMTVHAAKGLQAPIVILADTGSSQKTQSSLTPLFDPKDESAPPLLPVNVPRTAAGSAWAHRFAAEESAAEAESLRLLYVALTRAEDQLYICGWQGQRETSSTSWYRQLEGAMATLATRQPWPHWTGENLVLESTQQAPPNADRASPFALVTDTATPLEEWAQQPAKPERSPSRPLSPSRPEEAPPVVSPLLGQDTARFARGLAIHRLLQTLPDLPASERAAAGLCWLPPQLSSAVVDEALAVLSHPDCAHIFGPGSRPEVPIVGCLGPQVVSGQIDRLLVTPDAVWVIDYKTNRPPPTQVSETSPVYLRQLATYRAILQQIYPDRPIHAVLIWTYGPIVMPVPASLLDAHAPPSI